MASNSPSLSDSHGLTPQKWVPDTASDVCLLCEAAFTVTRRRHHCRACGKLFCAQCSINRVKLPPEFGYGDSIERVCFECFSKLSVITDEETKQSEHLIVGESIADYLYRGLVVLYDDQKRLEPILIIAKYRIFFFKRPPPGAKKIRLESIRNIHLYNILSLSHVENSPKRLEIAFVEAKREKHIIIASSEIPNIVLNIRKAYRAIMPKGIPDDREVINIDLPNAMLLPVPPLDVGLAGGFTDTYKAQCNYLGVEVSPEVLLYIEDVTIRENSFDFVMNDIPGVEGKNKLFWDMLPVTTALFQNNFFKSVSIDAVDRKDAPEMISGIMTFNKTITRLSITNMQSGTAGLDDLGLALKKNTDNALQVLDLSGCRLTGICVENLAIAIASFKHGLTALYLANCRLREKQSVFLLKQGLLKNLGCTSCIEELDLSYNRLDAEGSQALNQWFTDMGPSSHLRKLLLSGTQMVAGPVLRSVSKLPVLHTLILSHNKFDPLSCQCVCSALSAPPTVSIITTVSLSNCNFAPEVFVALASSLLDSKARVEDSATNLCVRLNFSSNNLDDSAIVPFSEFLNKTPTCNFELDLSGNCFTDRGLVQFFTALKTNSKVTSLILNNMNFRVTQANGERQVVTALQDLADNTPSLSCLSLSSGWSGPFMAMFLESMANNTILKELEISNNVLGELGGRALGHFLRWNKSLVMLTADNVQLSPSAWHSVSCDIQSNTTIQWFPFAWKEYDQSVNSCIPLFLERLRSNFIQIQDVCVKNRDAAKAAGLPIWNPKAHDSNVKIPTPINPAVVVPEETTTKPVDLRASLWPAARATGDSTTPAETSSCTTTTASTSPPLAPTPPPPDEEPSRSPPTQTSSSPVVEPSSFTTTATTSTTTSCAPPPPPPPPPRIPPRNVPVQTTANIFDEIRQFSLDSLHKNDEAPDDDAPLPPKRPTTSSSSCNNMGSMLLNAVSKRREFLEEEEAPTMSDS
ncbi:myosin-I binding protein [Pelomyxa schiedti]|nr:myosin-I binding protein [Pelomyxa schiedti]